MNRPPNFIKLTQGSSPKTKNLFSELNVGDRVMDIWYGGKGIVISKLKTKIVINFRGCSDDLIEGSRSWDKAHVNTFLRRFRRHKSERR